MERKVNTDIWPYNVQQVAKKVFGKSNEEKIEEEFVYLVRKYPPKPGMLWEGLDIIRYIFGGDSIYGEMSKHDSIFSPAHLDYLWKQYRKHDDDVIGAAVILPLLAMNAIYNYDNVLLDKVVSETHQIIKEIPDFKYHCKALNTWTPVTETALIFGDYVDDILNRFGTDFLGFDDADRSNVPYANVIYAGLKTGNLELLTYSHEYTARVCSSKFVGFSYV